mmetsp:Transcript_39259/g.88228  ORF Transcript_39259/g.88228 Transcript_39259/m.88228 type:complete len:558 (-) Transcript_39259:160-1833(-)
MFATEPQSTTVGMATKCGNPPDPSDIFSTHREEANAGRRAAAHGAGPHRCGEVTLFGEDEAVENQRRATCDVFSDEEPSSEVGKMPIFAAQREDRDFGRAGSIFSTHQEDSAAGTREGDQPTQFREDEAAQDYGIFGHCEADGKRSIFSESEDEEPRSKVAVSWCVREASGKIDAGHHPAAAPTRAKPFLFVLSDSDEDGPMFAPARAQALPRSCPTKQVSLLELDSEEDHDQKARPNPTGKQAAKPRCASIFDLSDADWLRAKAKKTGDTPPKARAGALTTEAKSTQPRPKATPVDLDAAPVPSRRPPTAQATLVQDVLDSDDDGLRLWSRKSPSTLFDRHDNNSRAPFRPGPPDAGESRSGLWTLDGEEAEGDGGKRPAPEDQPSCEVARWCDPVQRMGERLAEMRACDAAGPAGGDGAEEESPQAELQHKVASLVARMVAEEASRSAVGPCKVDTTLDIELDASEEAEPTSPTAWTRHITNSIIAAAAASHNQRMAAARNQPEEAWPAAHPAEHHWQSEERTEENTPLLGGEQRLPGLRVVQFEDSDQSEDGEW